MSFGGDAMPFYEYRCGSCGHEFEAMQKMNDAVLTDCPACDEPELRKLVSAAGFRLKGGGWYETDFKGGNKDKAASKGDSEGKETASSDSTKKEASQTQASEASSGHSCSTASCSSCN